MEVLFYIWSTKEKEWEVAERIATAFKNRINKISEPPTIGTQVMNLSSYGDVIASSPHFILGDKADVYVNQNGFPSWILPSLSKLEDKKINYDYRKKALDTIDAAVISLSTSNPIETQEVKKVVEAKDKTFGEVDTDFIITEREAEYLKKIKDLLDCSKIVISKGDVRIEIE